MSSIDDQPTILERPTPVSPSPTRGAPEPDTVVDNPAGETTTLVTATEALRDEEALRAIYIIRIARPFGIIILLLLPFVGGDVLSRYVLGVAVLAAEINGVWLERLFREPGSYSERKMMFLVVPIAFATFAGMLYVGVFSGASVFIGVALYFFSRRESLMWALSTYIVAAGFQLLLASLIIFDVVIDPGLVIAPDRPLHMLILAQVVVQVGYLAALLLGRASYRASVATIEKLQRATQLASQREAQLFEAREELHDALQLGGPGRYTGQRVGSYELGAIIGRGGMGEVYESRHVETGAEAAVKLLHSHAQRDQHQIARFTREIEAIRSLSSPHVATIFEACGPSDAITYYAMERLRGQDLADLMRSPEPLTTEMLRKLLREVGSLVDEAGLLGIVHRDLTPRNLFCADVGGGETMWKVLDFGVATLSQHSGTLTQGLVVGTPTYMTPEQAQGLAVDHRADIYALAAITYRWLTGRPAFYGKDVPSLLYQVVHTMPRRPSSFRDVPRAIDDVLAIGLAKEPEDRFDLAKDLAAAIDAALDDESDAELRERAAALLVENPWT